MVEHQLPKLRVVGSSPIARFASFSRSAADRCVAQVPGAVALARRSGVPGFFRTTCHRSCVSTTLSIARFVWPEMSKNCVASSLFRRVNEKLSDLNGARGPERLSPRSTEERELDALSKNHLGSARTSSDSSRSTSAPSGAARGARTRRRTAGGLPCRTTPPCRRSARSRRGNSNPGFASLHRRTR